MLRVKKTHDALYESHQCCSPRFEPTYRRSRVFSVGIRVLFDFSQNVMLPPFCTSNTTGALGTAKLLHLPPTHTSLLLSYLPLPNGTPPPPPPFRTTGPITAKESTAARLTPARRGAQRCLRPVLDARAPGTAPAARSDRGGGPALPFL